MSAAPENSAAPDLRPSRTPRHPVLRAVAVAVVALLVLAVSGFLIYANTTYAADAEPVQSVADNPAIHVDYTYDHVVMTPVDPAPGAPSASDLMGTDFVGTPPQGTGLVFLAGAKVDPLAYAYKLSGLV